jgi:hypothetical protein
MKKSNIAIGMACLLAAILSNCSNEDLASNASSSGLNLVDVAQTSGQLASGASFRISGSTEGDSTTNHPGHGPKGGQGRHHGPPFLDGLNLLAPTDELLAIVDAESASDFRGMRISKNGGATITNYNANGEVVALPLPATGGPGGCSFSGKQFPQFDSLLATITKTVINFGSGTTFARDTVTITRTGKIVVSRSGTKANMTETTLFDNYSVNGIKVEGTKTRVSVFNELTGSGSSTTSVANGKFTFTDGTSAIWTSEKKRASEITLDATTKRPVSGTITTTVNTAVTSTDGTVVYSHSTTKPLIENLACEGRRHGPVSGTLHTIYRSNTLDVDYGDGSCENRTVSITLNGVTTTKTIGQ